MNIDKFYEHLVQEETKAFINQLNNNSELEEMAYPSNFDLDYFKKLNSFNKKIQYCKQMLEYVGGGSSRMVFKIDNDKCLKLAKNKKGLEQNYTESDWSLQNYYSVTARIYDYDERIKEWAEGEDNEFVQEIIDMMGNYDIAWGDLCRGSSYGVTADKRVVLIDFGATDEIINNHYK